MAVKKAALEKKGASVKTPASKKTGTGMMSPKDLENYYAAQAEIESGRLPAGVGNKLSIKGGSFTYRGADLGETIDVVVLGFVFRNEFYGDAYDPENPSIPACYAISADRDGMAPHEDAPEPQHEECDSCELNQFGTAERGRGKACKNIRFLAIISASDLDNSPTDIEIVLLSVPPSSIGAFDKHVKGVNKVLKRPVNGVITRLSFDEGEDFVALKFETVEGIKDPGHAATIKAKADQAAEMLLMPYDTSNYVPLADREKARKKRPAVKKAPAKQATSKFAGKKK